MSLTNAGAEGTDQSVDSSISGNGNLVAFKSNAPNLVASDTNASTADIFIRDRSAATTRLVSLTAAGTQFAAPSEEPAVSSDGSTVAWETGGQIYVRTLPSGPTELVSKTPANAPASGVSHEPALSANGRYVAYWSTANDIGTPDPAFTADVFLYDRTAGTTELVSVGTGNVPASSGDGSFLPSMSGDARYVVFETLSPFAGASDTNAAYDIYLRDRVTSTTRLVSHTSSGVAGNGPSFEGNGGPVISQDASTVAFTSSASDLSAGDTNNRTDVFVWHAASNTVEQASVSTAGAEGLGASGRPDVNADGTIVAFQSESALHVWDTNSDIDIYVRHYAPPVRTTLESLSYNGQSVPGNKLNASLNGDGKLVSFHSTSTGLVANDTNSRDDVFVHELGVADTTAPSVTGAATTAPNAEGWYNAPVVVQWTAVDPQPSSGQPAAPPNTTASTQGKDVVYTSGSACDANMNCATGTVKLSIDLTAPTVTATINNAPISGWYGSDVVVGFTCTDALSKIASCPAAQHFTAQGAGQTIPAPARTATDRAGNAAIAPVPPVNIDLTPPVVAFSGPTSYDVDDVVSITCTASDALSGIAQSTCVNVSGPAYLYSFGTNVVNATVVDKAGNITTATYTFTVNATAGGLETFTCALLGAPGSKRLAHLCKKLTDDLEDARAAIAAGNTKKRDENIRKFLKDASGEVGKAITAGQMVILSRIANSFMA